LHQVFALGHPNICFAPLNVVPLISVRPFLVPIKVETDIKKYS